MGLFSILIETKALLQTELLNVNDEKDVPMLQTCIQQITDKINIMDRYKTEGSIFRSKCLYVREGEKNTKYFFGLEKSRYLSKNMKCIIDSKGKVIKDQVGIMKEQTLFYHALYSKEADIRFAFTRSIDDPCLNLEQQALCDKPLLLDELYDALMMLKANKCPGISGLPPEFYRQFWKDLREPLYNMYLYSYEKGILPLSIRRGVISLIPKKKKDTRFIKNMRPPTLLNTDYKILAKALDNRLQEVLPMLISQNQTRFLQGRNISTNIRKSLDIIEYCKANNKPALILSIDMEKCFDRIDYSAITGSLRYFKFGEDFIKWVSLFYTSFEVCTQNFGFFSDWFTKSQSVNQGCNISPAIYVLAGEVLALKL